MQNQTMEKDIYTSEQPGVRGENLKSNTESISPPGRVADAVPSFLLTPYLPLLNNRTTNELRGAAKKDFAKDSIINMASLTTSKGVRFVIRNFDKLRGSLGTPAKKLLDTAILYLTYNNVYGSKTIRATVEIPLIEYGEANGNNLTPLVMETKEAQEAENKRIEGKILDFKKKVREDLTDIENMKFSAEETRGQNRGNYTNVAIISSHSIRTVKGVPVIHINFDVEFAGYLVKSYVMQYPTALLKLDNRNPNAYALGCYIANHNSMDANIKRGTESTLSVKKLLEAAPEIISYEALRARGERNWKRLIKNRLELALNSMVEIGYVKTWQYRDGRMNKTYDAVTAGVITSWDDYFNLMVDFKLLDNPMQHHQDERRKRKAEQKAIAVEKKQKQLPKKTKAKK